MNVTGPRLHHCIMCQLIRAQRSCFTTGCSIYVCAGIAHRGVLEELDICDCDCEKLGQHIEETMAVAVTNFHNFLMVTFSYNQRNR